MILKIFLFFEVFEYIYIFSFCVYLEGFWCGEAVGQSGGERCGNIV